MRIEEFKRLPWSRDATDVRDEEFRRLPRSREAVDVRVCTACAVSSNSLESHEDLEKWQDISTNTGGTRAVVGLLQSVRRTPAVVGLLPLSSSEHSELNEASRDPIRWENNVRRSVADSDS